MCFGMALKNNEQNQGELMKKTVFLLLFVPVFLFGQTTKITLEEALKIVQQNNRTLQQARLSLAQSEKEIKIQRSNYLPSVQFGHKTSYVSEIAQISLPFSLPGIGTPQIEAGVKDQFDYNISLTQPLFTGFRTKNLVKSAIAQKELQSASLQAVQNKLFLQTGQLYYGIQLLGLQRDILQKGVERTEAHLQILRNMLQAKQIAAYDTLEAASRKLQMQTQQQNLMRMEQIQLSKFELILNASAPINLQKITTETAAFTAPESRDDFLRAALENRPELEQLRKSITAGNYGVKAIESVYWPQVFAAAAYHYARPGVNFFQNEWMDYYTLGLQLQWTLWNGGRERKKAEKTRLDIEKVQLQFTDTEKAIRQQVEEAMLQLQNAQEQIALQQQLVAQAQERARVVSELYSQSQVGSLEVDDAEMALTQAELQLQSAKIEWFVQSLNMDYVTGMIGQNIK